MFNVPLARLPSLVAALLLASCASVDGFQYARDVGPAEVTRRAPESGEVVVVWRFGTPEWVKVVCSQAGKQQVVHGCVWADPAGGRCLLFAVAPSGFDDRERLAVLGHEFWHCQGALHG